jgi:tRNA/tmRNA/rRNA uracil-C5-methylase (TrmA/RlmC/RlmD family)
MSWQDGRVVSDASLLDLKTGPIAAGGGCVARAGDGRVVFVRHAVPGERVLAAVTEETKSYLRADALEIIRASENRVAPPCPYAGPGRCGGCDWQHIAPLAQRKLKVSLVAEQLRRLAGIEWVGTVEEVPGSPDGLGWRTRVRFAVDDTGQVGLHRHRSHSVHVVDHCLIASQAVEALGVEGHEWPGVEDIEVFASSATGESILSLSVRGRQFGHLPTIEAGLVVNGRVVRDPDHLAFEVLHRHYEVGAGVFWQVHPGATDVLGRAVLAGLGTRPGDHVADLYAGAGLFTGLLGPIVGPNGSVLAVERDRWACADAAQNSADLPQVQILKAAVTPAFVTRALGKANLVLLDPAREGAGRPVMSSIAALVPGPRRIAYVSCDPASFARDLRVLLDAGWTLNSLQAFDLFPMTEHVELVAFIEPAKVRATNSL